MRVVRAFVREPAEAARFAGANDDLTATALQVGKLQALMWPTVTLVFNASSVAVLWFGSQRIADGALEIGALIAYLGYLMQILVARDDGDVHVDHDPARRGVRRAHRRGARHHAGDRAAGRAGRARRAHAAWSSCAASSSAIRARAAPVLADISFVARPGEVTAIIGSTGAGKTTLLELIPRLSDPTAGTVLVDGVDVRQREPEELWARIGMVPQRSYLFTGTVASNLRFGNPDATDDELWAALELAQGADFVRAMPQQLDAPIAQGGTNVSGGQRQRLAIARALLREPAVFLFDDSFSALDLATEARLRAAIAPRLAKATVILVAQRVASIRDARSDPRARRRQARRQRHARAARRDLPALRGDRRIADRAGRGGGMSTNRPAPPAQRPAGLRDARSDGRDDGPAAEGEELQGLGAPAARPARAASRAGDRGARLLHRRGRVHGVGPEDPRARHRHHLQGVPRRAPRRHESDEPRAGDARSGRAGHRLRRARRRARARDGALRGRRRCSCGCRATSSTTSSSASSTGCAPTSTPS